MQQLTIQFEGYADSRQPIDAGTAKQCNPENDTAARLGRAVTSSAMSRNLVGHDITSRLKALIAAPAARLRSRFDAAVEESDFCQVLGITPWHFTLEGVAVTAALGAAIVLVCGLAEWLEGGAL